MTPFCFHAYFRLQLVITSIGMFAGAMVEVALASPVVTRHVTLRTGVSGSTAAMKFEIYGCPANATTSGLFDGSLEILRTLQHISIAYLDYCFYFL